MNTTKWTPELERQAAAAISDKDVAALARRVGVTGTAVRLVGRQARSRMAGEAPEPHRWTAAEDAALLRTRTAEGARKVGARVGVDPEVAVHRRQLLRSKRGETRPRHIWTDEEKRAIREAPTVGEARAWAREHGLSEHTAKRRWYELQWKPSMGL